MTLKAEKEKRINRIRSSSHILVLRAKRIETIIILYIIIFTRMSRERHLC